MKNWKFATWLVPALLVATALPAAASGDLIISEYVEGSSNNKALEIWNHTGGPIDLTAGGYKVQIYSNGSPTVTTTITLTGVLANNDTYVIAHNLAVAALTSVADLQTGSLNFNGDDAVILVKSAANTIVDALGQIGVDPGTEWGAGNQSTADNTIRRNTSICKGDTDGSNVFDPSIEWSGFAVDTFGDVGQHTDTCGPVPSQASSWGSVKTLYR
jgi:predicted extracellular nuclease